MKFKDERWKSIKGYEGLYEVSDWGNVRSLNYLHTGKTKLLSTRDNGKGYLYVFLSKNGKRKGFRIHRVVYEAFRGPIPKGLTIDHVNGDKTDNRLENLQLLTRGDNARKANNKQLDLIEAQYPHREYTFKNSYEASFFFNYKAKETVGNYITYARKRGLDYINIRGTRYLFSQEA